MLTFSITSLNTACFLWLLDADVFERDEDEAEAEGSVGSVGSIDWEGEGDKRSICDDSDLVGELVLVIPLALVRLV